MRLIKPLLVLTLLAPAAARADVLTIQTRELEDAQVGVHYQRQLVATGGTNAYVWRVLSDMPAGLDLTADGIVQGVPTSPGEFQFLVEVNSGSQTVDGTVTLAVSDPFPMSVATTSLAPGFVGKPYSQQLQVSGGVGPYSWSIVTGSLPAGLSVVQPDLISGTPQEQDPAGGAPPFTAQVMDSRGATATAQLRISVKPDLPFDIETATLPDGVVGQPYTQTLTASGGATPYTFTVVGLPMGLAATAADGGGELIAGTPTESGLFTVQVTAQDIDHRVAVRQLFLSCSTAALRIATQELPDAQVGKLYAVALVSVPDGASWTLLQGQLPAGLSLSSDGIITGTPTATGSAELQSTFVVSASRSGLQGVQTLSIDVLDPSVKTDVPSKSGGGCDAAGTGTLLPGLLVLLLLRSRKLQPGLRAVRCT